MIRLGTVFSGIGAIEHALQRMELEHEIVFACDNGDVDILSKKIPMNLDEIDNEVYELNNLINAIKTETEEDKDEKDNLIKSLTKNSNEYEKIKKVIAHMEGLEFNGIILNVLKSIVNMKDIKKARLKEYKEFIDNIMNPSQTLNTTFLCLIYMQSVLDDYKKDNQYDKLTNVDYDFISTDNISWKLICEDVLKIHNLFEELEGKKLIKKVKDICERLGMLHEKIDSFHISKKLIDIDNYSEKKKFVDNLYKGKESQNKVRQSYMQNYNITDDQFHWNVSFLDGKQYEGQIDLFVGGSPCQSFSLVGKQRGLEDTRGTLFYEYARLVSEIKPKVFIYENVKALLSNDGGRTWETIQKIFTDLNYTWSFKVLNAKDYGIPQNRERIFVVGFRNDLVLQKKFQFPKELELKKTMQDFLLDNVSGKYYLNKKGAEFVTSEKNLTKRYTQIDGIIQLCQKKNQQFNWHGDFVFEEENSDKEKTMKDLEKYFLSEKVKKYVLASGTKGFYSKPKTDLEIARPLLTTMHKMHRAGVDNYVTTEGRLRKLTPRECLRLMGFCDSFKIVVSDTAAYQQAGNSIVVDVLINIMKSILESYPQLLEN